MGEQERRAPRLRDRVTVVVTEIRRPDSDTVEKGSTLSCRTADLSASGARLSSEWHAPEGTELKVALIFKNPPAHFIHKGLIRWVKKSAEPGRYLTGIQFLHADDTPDPRWVKFVEDRFPAASPGNAVN